MQSNIKKDYFWNTLGVFAQNAISPLLLIAVTRINGIYDSGVFSFAFSVSIIFWAIGMWGGRTYQVSDVKNEFSQRGYITVRLLLSLVMLVGVFIFVIVNQYDQTKAAILIGLVVLKAIESIVDSLYGVMQVNNKLYVSGQILLGKSFLGIITFVIIDIFTGNLFAACLSLLAINVLFLLVCDLPIANSYGKFLVKIKTDQNKVFLESLLIIKKCAPVFIVTFLAMFSLNIPRYVVDIYHNESIGYLGIIAMPITLIVLLMSFILQPNVRALSELIANKEYDRFNKTINKIIIVTASIGLTILTITYFIGVWALELLFGIDFSTYQTPLLVIVLGGIMNAIVGIFISTLIILRSLWPQLIILFVTNGLLVLFSLMLIPDYGVLAAAWLFAVTSITQLILLIISLRIKLAYEKRK
jgi:O-antigen/teichoic acid export membrane protein